VQLLSGEQHRRNGEQHWQGTDHQSSVRNRREGEPFELKEEYDGHPERRGGENPDPFRPGKARAVKEQERQHAGAREKQTNQTMVETGISRSAILPKKNPVPHRHPAVASAKMGKKRLCRSDIASDDTQINCSGGHIESIIRRKSPKTD
jgi:hypothetical protein